MALAVGTERLDTAKKATGHRFWSAARSWGRFALHFGEMWLAMAVGMMVFHVVTGSGHDSSPGAASLAYQVGMIVSMTVPMVLWMRLRGHGWRHGAEMSVGMLAPVVAIYALIGLGVAETMSWLSMADHPAMALGMLGAMLLRREQYAGGHRMQTPAGVK